MKWPFCLTLQLPRRWNKYEVEHYEWASFSVRVVWAKGCPCVVRGVPERQGDPLAGSLREEPAFRWCRGMGYRCATGDSPPPRLSWEGWLQRAWGKYFARVLKHACSAAGAGFPLAAERLGSGGSWRKEEYFEQMSCLREPTGNTTAASSQSASSGLWQGPSSVRTWDTHSHCLYHWDPLLLLLLLLLPLRSPLQHSSQTPGTLWRPTCRYLNGNEHRPIIFGGSK